MTSFLDTVIVVVDVAFIYGNTTLQIKADSNKMEIFLKENCVTTSRTEALARNS